MSINTIVLSPMRTPTPLQDEIEIRNVENIEYTVALLSRKFEGKGKIFLTDIRLSLVADGPTEGFETLDTLHTSLLSVKTESPRLNLFAAARIVVEVKPAPNGGLGDAPARVELRLGKGGDKDAFQSFAAGLEKTRERAVNKSRANPEDEFDLPAYGGPGPSSSSSTTYVTVDVPSDAPPGYEP